MKTTAKAKRRFQSRRLLALADFLEKLPRKRFDYGGWTCGADRAACLSIEGKCGSLGCALGWAPSVPSIARAGLRLVDGLPTLRRLGKPSQSQFDITVAASEVFGIERDEAARLFIPSMSGLKNGSDSTPKQVARHIRKFVEQKRKA